MENIEQRLQHIDERLESIWEVISNYPNVIGFASNLDKSTKKFKRRTTKEDIRLQLTKQWNKEHPFYKVNP